MLLTADLKTHLYGEQITVISRNDADLMNSAIKAAEGEAKGYLSRYDIAVIFAKQAAERDETLLTFLKDIATWNFITLANAAADMEFRESRYKLAIAWLKGVQSGKVVPFGWPLLSAEAENSFFHITSAPKRETNF